MIMFFKYSFSLIGNFSAGQADASLKNLFFYIYILHQYCLVFLAYGYAPRSTYLNT